MKRNQRARIGLAIVVLGILILLQNIADVIGFHFSLHRVFSIIWPCFLLYLGINGIRSGRKGLFPYFLSGIGAILAIRAISSLHPAYYFLSDISWPLIIIGLGALLIVKSNAKKQDDQDAPYYYRSQTYQFRDFEDDLDTTAEDDKVAATPHKNAYTFRNDNASLFDREDRQAVDTRKADYSQQTERTSSQKKAFRKLNTNFGSKNIKLSEQHIPEGESLIELNCKMGEIRLTLPRSVNILLDGTISIGEIRFLNKKYDGLSTRPRARYTAPNNATKTVRICANVSLGEIRIKLSHNN